MKRIKIAKPIQNQLNDAGRVILDAFRDEAIASSFMDLSREKIRKSYFQVIRFKIGLYRETGQPLFAALMGNRVVGMAVLKSPRAPIPRLRMLCKALPSLPRMLGLLPCSLRAARLGRLVTSPGNLPANSYTLDLLAVHRSCQGRGIGRMLLEHAARICAADKGSPGIYLLTGDKINRTMYEKFGYGLWETRSAGSLTAYHMFKAKPF